jgi:hypothetical protein
MDQVKVSMHQELKAACFRASRGAFLIMDAGDVRRVKHVLQQKGRSWSHMTAFNFACIALRVKRCIPSPMVLCYRVKAVFDFFMDKKDTLTGKPLFHAEAKKAAQRVLAATRRGEFSDPPEADFHVRKTDKSGREMVDSDGLWLCRSIRGTSNLESLHQKLTKVFGHKRVGPQCSGNCHFCTGAIGRLQNEIGLSFLVSAIGTGLRPTPSMICMRHCLGCQSFHAGVNRGTLPPNHHTAWNRAPSPQRERE